MNTRTRCAGGALLMAALVSCGGASADGSPVDVLLVTLDTTRADRLGAYGHPAGATPTLDALAEQGVLFEQASTPVPITLPAHSSLLTGTFPPFHGVRDNGTFHLSDESTTLAEILSAEGFATGAFVAARVLDRRHGLAQGFDVYADASLPGPGSPTGALELPAGEVVDRTIAWLDGLEGRRFFAWVHLFDPHQPYLPPGEFRARFEGDPYLGEIAYADAQIGRLVEYLDETGRGATTLVVVTSDHGEGLGEHGEQTHSVLTYESTLRVPMIWRGPGLTPGRRVTTPVSLVDVLPGVLARLDLVPRAVQGVDPLGLGNPRRADPERSLYFESEFAMRNFGWSALRGFRRGDLKFTSAPRSELFDLGRDPGEQRELLAGEPDHLRALEASLAELREDLAHGRPASSSELELSEVDARQLEALGYAGEEGSGGGPAGAEVDPKDRVEYAGRVMGLWLTFQAGDLAGARRDAELILAENPEVVLAWSTLGAITAQEAEALHAEGRIPESEARFASALEQFERALALDPARIDCMMAKGAALRRLGRLDEASETFERCIRIQPDYALPYRLRGRLLEGAGESDAAREHYRRFLELTPQGSRAALSIRERLHALGAAPE